MQVLKLVYEPLYILYNVRYMVYIYIHYTLYTVHSILYINKGVSINSNIAIRDSYVTHAGYIWIHFNVTWHTRTPGEGTMYSWVHCSVYGFMYLCTRHSVRQCTTDSVCGTLCEGLYWRSMRYLRTGYDVLMGTLYCALHCVFVYAVQCTTDTIGGT